MSSVPCNRSIRLSTISPTASRRDDNNTLLECQGESERRRPFADFVRQQLARGPLTYRCAAVDTNVSCLDLVLRCLRCLIMLCFSPRSTYRTRLLPCSAT